MPLISWFHLAPSLRPPPPSVSPAGPSIPSAGYPKRSQTSTAENDIKEEGGGQARKSGGRGGAPGSPLLGNANNPNKADIPDRKKGSTTPVRNAGCAAAR